MRGARWFVLGAVVLVAAWLVVRQVRPSQVPLLSRADVAAVYPTMRVATQSTSREPVRTVGRRCGLVPNESGGQGTPVVGGTSRSRRFGGTDDAHVPTVVETTARFASVGRAEAVVGRYRDYLERCAGRRYGGDWEGTVASSPWSLPDVGDQAVGMVDRIDDRGGPSTQRVAVVRTGSSVVVLRVADRGTTPPTPGPVVRLLRDAVVQG